MTSEIRTLTTSAVLEIIEQAHNAELCLNLYESEKLLSTFFDNFPSAPIFVYKFKPVINAEILRLAGFYLSNLGRAKNKFDYQETGRNLLTEAVRIFENEGLPHKSAEARVILALCYFYEGAVEESEAILSQAESEYADNEFHPVYLKILVNRLLCFYSHQDYEKGFELLERMKGAMEFCGDERLLSQYHNHAGMLCQASGKAEKGFYHYKNAIHFARRTKHYFYEAANLNNLANLCKDLQDFTAAHHYTNLSLAIFENTAQPGWIAHVRDTKALIYLAEEKFAEALAEINSALEIFAQGEDYSGLADAHFNRARINLRCGDKPQSLLDLAQAVQIARMRVSEDAAKNYSAAFARLIYAKKGGLYKTEIREFKKHLICESLQINNLQVTQTAAALGISHQCLSDILDKQFPEIYDETGLQRRKRFAGCPAKKVKLREIYTESPGKNIQILAVNHEDIVLPDSLADKFSGQLFSFVLKGSLMPELRCDGDCIVLVSEVAFPHSCRVIARHKISRELVCLNLGYDDFTQIYFLNDNSPEPLSLEDYMIFGKIVAFQPLENISGKKIVFQEVI